MPQMRIPLPWQLSFGVWMARPAGHPSAQLARRFSALFLLCFLFAAVPVCAQISPGPLAKAHQGLNGPSNCTQCHSVSTRSAAFRCTECHSEIASEIQNHHGLHASFPQGGAPGAACVKCHSDHNGENFNMLHWDPTPKGFDHSKTGYVLDGKHTTVACRTCHSAQHIAASERAFLSRKDLNHTFMGLSANCLSCHEDKHQGRFGVTCTQCHSTSSWKSAKIDEHNFDHSKTRFKLVGLHLNTPCLKCHTQGNDGQPRYTGLQFSTCAACHTDPHKGEFKQDCISCHTPFTWKKSSFAGTFDHSKTKFPLLGKHTSVACVTCHKSGDFKTPIPHSVCADCHKTEPHGGQFLKDPDGGQCERCHTVQGWNPSTYGIAEHARTAFPLVAPHAKVACKGCHTAVDKIVRYKIRFAQCVDCHKDEHKGQFSGAPWRNQCQACHVGLTFKTSNYTLALHQKSTFPLTGGHLAVACIDCHKPNAALGTAAYHFSPLTCTSCHEDIHKGQLAARMARLDAKGNTLGCLACHSTKEWHDLTKFDHDATGFALVGSHRAVACADCHRPPQMERTLLHVNFTQAPKLCNECHENPHGDQFGVKANDCSSCHNSNEWKPSLFDHEKAGFSLKGGHQNVACAACHTNKRIVAGVPILFYKPTTKACEACHGTTVPQAPAKTG
jgi:hypothetical protein